MLLLAVSPAVAQTGTPGRQVQLRLLAFDNAHIPPEAYAFDPAAPPATPGVEVEVKDYLNHEGVTLQLLGSEVLFAKSGKAEDAKDPALQLAKVNLPRTGNQFMLIFLPDGKGAYRILPLDDSMKEFPLGSYRVISLSRLPVKLMLEKKSWDLAPGQTSIIEDPPVQENQHSAMQALAQIDGKWERISTGLWPHPGKKRAVQLFFDNPVSKQTELRGFKDVAPPEIAPNPRKP